ncbi:MAG: hypothetical protein ABI690_18305 [Chloroflexota bacterium]
MDIYLVVMRLIHIVAAFLWFGTGFYSSMFLFPALAEVGDAGSTIMKVLAKNRLFVMIFPVSAGVTVLAGILLYIRPGETGLFSSAGWMSISIGALFGILAAGHGGAVVGRTTTEYIKKLMSGTAQQDELTALATKLARNANISLILMIIAMLGMELARYL